MRFLILLASMPLWLALAVDSSAQVVVNRGSTVPVQQQFTRRFNPSTGQYELYYQPTPVQTTVPLPVSPVSPFPVNPTPTGPVPYPTYPYVYPNPYPGGNWNNVRPPSGSQSVGRQVAGWYSRYLRRQIDQAGLQAHSTAYVQSGPESALAGILGSQEYYRIWGNTPKGFVQGLYSDVLRRPAQPSEVATWASQVGRKSLTQIAFDFLAAARRELGGPYY